MKLKEDIIREMADSLLCGMECYYHRPSNTFIEYPKDAEDHYMKWEENPWQEVIDKVENNPEEYITVEPMPSFRSFEVMEKFARIVDSLPFAARLLDVLSRKRPFRNFNDLVENDFDYRQDWFDFRLRENMEWVKDQIEFE